MKTFNSPKAFAEHLLLLAAIEEHALHRGLEKAAKLVEKTAKSEIGHLQPEVGPFPEWAELADSTKEEKARLGYFFNDDYNPLLRTGELQESYTHEVKGLEAVIGSKSDIAVYHEFGTPKMPPRPVLGPAAFRNKEKIRAIIGVAAVSGLLGGEAIHESLGYNFNTDD